MKNKNTSSSIPPVTKQKSSLALTDAWFISFDKLSGKVNPENPEEHLGLIGDGVSKLPYLFCCKDCATKAYEKLKPKPGYTYKVVDFKGALATLRTISFSRLVEQLYALHQGGGGAQSSSN